MALRRLLFNYFLALALLLGAVDWALYPLRAWWEKGFFNDKSEKRL
jgi:hypothetical protein